MQAMHSSRRVSSARAVPSICGSSDGNGAVGEERKRRKASAARSLRVAQLQRVDEETRDQRDQRVYASDVRHDRGLQSPLSSPLDFSCDEEIENHSFQGDRRASAVSFSTRKVSSRTATPTSRASAVAHRSSLRPPLQNLSPSRRSSRFGSPEYVAATLDEKKQKKLVALFYWRRKTLETYLSAWKWVTFDAWRLERQEQHNQQEMTLLRPYAPIAVRPVERRPSHHNALLRSAHKRQQQDTVAVATGSGSLVEAPRDRIRSLREEYRQLKAVERQQAEPVAEENEPFTFKERLKIYFRCFEAWREFVDTSRAAQREAMERAVKWRSQRVVKKHFRAWAKPFMLLRHSEILQWERASGCGDVLAMKRRFLVWRQWLAWTRNVKDWQAASNTKRQIKAVGKWRAWVERTSRVRQLQKQQQHQLKLRSFQQIKQLRTERQKKEQATQLADTLRDRNARKHAWLLWKHCVFYSDDAKRREKLIVQVAGTLAVSKWKRFTARRRADHERAIQADSCLYEVLLRRSWVRWRRYLFIKHTKRLRLEHASNHKATQDMRRVVRLWIALRCDAQYERDQARGAVSFYEQRLVQSMFRRCKTYATDLRSAREWRIQRVKRRFVLCFVAWRQHSQRSGRLRILYNTVEVSHRQRLKVKTLREWRQLQRLSAAFAIVAATHRRILLQLHVHAWHKVSAQRQQWRSCIENSHRKRSLRLKQRLLVAWFGVVVRTQCRSKLVRLFQKKHSRKRLKRCVRVLRIHSTLQHLQARSQRRCIESVWHAWMVYVSDQQHKTEAVIAADQFYNRRRYATAVSTWGQNTRTWIVERRYSNRALSFLITCMMRTTLQAWCAAVHTQRHQRRLIDLQVRRRRERLLHRCVMRWKSTARRKAKKRKVHNLLCHHLMYRLQRSCFMQWCEYTKHQQASRQRLRETQQTRLCRVARVMLQAWRIVAFRLHHKRLTTQAAAAHNRKRVLRKMLRVWCVAAAERHRYCSNRSKAVAFHREFLLLWAFFGWQHASLASQVLKEKQRRAVNAITQRRLQKAVSLWRNMQRMKHADQLLQGRAVHFYRQRRRRKAVRLWHSITDARVQTRRENQRAEAFANAKITRRCLQAWIQFTSGTRVFKLKLRVVFQTGDDDILRKVFRRWRRYKRSSTLCLRADSWRKHKRLDRIWRHWRAQVTFAHKMKANVLVTSRLLQSNTLRATFVQWKKYVVIRHDQLDASKRAETFHVRRCLQLAIGRFRVQFRHARALELSETFHVKHALHQYWKHWLTGMEYQRQWRTLKTLAITTHRSSTFKQVFHLWKGLVEAKQCVLYLKADRLCGNLALKHVWRAWKCVKTCKSIVNKAAATREKRAKRGAFIQWREFTHEQQLIRRHVNAAVAHLDRVTMQKIWERWLGFLEQRRLVHHVEAKARAFYSTRILQTRSLRSWGRFVQLRHSKHEQRVEVEAFYSVRSTRKYFSQLHAYALHRHQQAAMNEKQDEVVQLAVQKRAIAKWHARAVVLHSMRQAQTQAVQFHKDRRLSEAIGSLTNNKVTKTKMRHDTLRAIAHCRLRLSLATFARWKAFITWRQRHKYLLRLFRTNHLGDYFALWHKYVVRSQRKRELQTKATRGYRQLLERNAFTRWRERCIDWQNKRRAVDWFVSRQTRQVFTVWSHRVRILRKMRQMFRFQDAFRKESHFAVWKRRWWLKKQQVARVQDASKWFIRHRLAKCFSLWACWLDSKRQEKHTLRMAVGFQRRFFSRKYLTAWYGVVLWLRRKQALLQQARQHATHTKYRRVWSQLQAYRGIKKRLRVTASEASEALMALGAQRVVNQWKRRVNQRRADQSVLELANHHCGKKLLMQTWRLLQRWFSIRKGKRELVKRADVHFKGSVCGRLLLAWSDYAQRMRRLRIGLQRFKMHYFRSVADECFYEWKAVIQLKRKLRMLKQRVHSSRQRLVLHAWHVFTQRALELRSVERKIHQLTRLNLLRLCLTHWEIVATDRWMYANLVSLSLQLHERRLKKTILERWNKLRLQQLARKRWRLQARERHAVSLRQLLQKWRAIACNSGSEEGFEHSG